MTGWVDADWMLGHEPQGIEHVLSLLGIDGVVSSSEMSAPCPLHDDRSPSFSVNLDSGLWFCHAGCGGGSLEHLVAQAAGLRPSAARKWLRGVCLGTEPDDDTEAEYLEYDEAIWRQWLRAPPERELESRGISAQAAADLGILWDYHTRGTLSAWVLPVRHPDDFRLIGWEKKISGSWGDDGVWTGPGTKKSHTLFGIDQYTPGDPVILVESPLDVAVLRTAGLQGLASFGTNVSRRQRRLLASRASQVVLAMDNDDAGREAHRKLVRAPEFAGGSEVELLLFNYDATPDAKDVGEMGDDEIREALRTAKRIRRCH